MAIFHFTVKIVGRSKGKSVISASAYLNGDVMKNEETGRISYYTSKKEVVYTSLMMCKNAPPEWLHVPEENIKKISTVYTIVTFTQTIAGWVVLTGKNMAQISDGIFNPVIAGIIYWLIRILVCGGCLVGAGILIAFIGIKIAGLYKKYCWDMITIMVMLISMAIAIYFGDWIKNVLPVNLLLLLLFVQLVYVGIRWYVKGWRETREYYR